MANRCICGVNEQQWAYGLLKYSILGYCRYFCRSCIYDHANTPYTTLMPKSRMNVEMPTRCGVWGSEMTRQKGALKQMLLLPPCLLQELQLPGVLGWGAGPHCPGAAAQSRAGAQPRHLWLHTAFVLPAGEGAQRLVWALSSALSLSQPFSVFQLRSQSSWQSVEKLRGQGSSEDPSRVTAKFNTWMTRRKYETGECGSLDL